MAPLTCQDTKLRKVRFQLQRKLRQWTSKGNEFSARVSVSEISCPDFRKTLRKSLQMHCNVRTMASPNKITCFHVIDLYRGKVKFEWWLELIIAILSSFPRIRFLDEWTHSFPRPTSLQSALHALDTWSRANIDNQSLPRSVWQDLGTIKGCLPASCDDGLSNDPGRELVYHGIVRPQLVDYIQYASTDFLQASHHVVLCCPANLETNSAALRYVMR